MAGEKNAGSIVYEISAEVEPLLQGGKQAIDALDKLEAAAQQSAWVTRRCAIRPPPAATRSTGSPRLSPTFSSTYGTETLCNSRRAISLRQLRSWTVSYGRSTASNRTQITRFP